MTLTTPKVALCFVILFQLNTHHDLATVLLSTPGRRIRPEDEAAIRYVLVSFVFVAYNFYLQLLIFYEAPCCNVNKVI